MSTSALATPRQTARSQAPTLRALLFLHLVPRRNSCPRVWGLRGILLLVPPAQEARCHEDPEDMNLSMHLEAEHGMFCNWRELAKIFATQVAFSSTVAAAATCEGGGLLLGITALLWLATCSTVTIYGCWV